MRKPLANSPTVPIQISAFRIVFISLTSPLVNAFKSFSKFAFTDTPRATDFQTRRLFTLDHTLHGGGTFEAHQRPLGLSANAER